MNSKDVVIKTFVPQVMPIIPPTVHHHGSNNSMAASLIETAADTLPKYNQLRYVRVLTQALGGK